MNQSHLVLNKTLKQKMLKLKNKILIGHLSFSVFRDIC